MSAAAVSLVATAVLGIVPYRHEYVLMVAWATTSLIALLALVLVGARAFRWDLIGSVAGSALLGSAAGVLASVLDSSDPDGFPSGAAPRGDHRRDHARSRRALLQFFRGRS